MENPVVTIEMENGGIITAELYPDVAPQSVYNFIALANQGFYDGLIFHRVIPGFMIQGGCPEGTGMGGPGYCIKGEFLFNGVDNKLKHKRGVLSMARAMSPNSAGSQFFIMHQDAPHLEEDIRFHVAIAQASKNIVVPKIIPVINRSVDMLIAMTHSALLQETIETHRAIADASATISPGGVKIMWWRIISGG